MFPSYMDVLVIIFVFVFVLLICCYTFKIVTLKRRNDFLFFEYLVPYFVCHVFILNS